jgi:hypothetical protein
MKNKYQIPVPPRGLSGPSGLALVSTEPWCASNNRLTCDAARDIFSFGCSPFHSPPAPDVVRDKAPSWATSAWVGAWDAWLKKPGQSNDGTTAGEKQNEGGSSCQI